MNNNKIIKNIMGTLFIPILFFVILEVICLINNVKLMPSASSFSIFMINVAVTTLTTISLSTNLNSGRFDFSLGSIAVLSVVLASKIAYPLFSILNSYPFILLGISVCFGLLLGLLSGTLYVLIQIPPIITSLGVTLIYEGIAFTVAGGRYLTSEVQVSSLMSFVNKWYYVLIIIFVVVLIAVYLFQHTNFGYKYKALKEGQKLAVDQGIKEIPNAILCYVFAGALMSIVGFLQAGLQTQVNATSLNFGSISIMFSAFLPMFIGGYISRYSNEYLGYFLAAISTSLLSIFFSAFHDYIDSSAQSIITALLLVWFLIFLSNEEKLKNLFKKKK